MRKVSQTLDTIEASLTEMDAEWMDPFAEGVIAAIGKIQGKNGYDADDLAALLDADFQTGITVIRLFLDLSKDRFRTVLSSALGGEGVGVKRYRADREGFLDTLGKLGAADAMQQLVARRVVWSDLLVERLKGGRGRAVAGQARGRSLEDFVEQIVAYVFEKFDKRCSFVGKDGRQLAKADFAIPSRERPDIVIEAKGYAATGSKQSDVIGDLNAITRAKRNDTTLLFVTDGLTWRQRRNDLRKIVALQNTGEITRIYTRMMRDQMFEDLETLKREYEI